jgi:hypothetical protein
VWNIQSTTIRINEWKPGPAEAEEMSPPPPFKPPFELRELIHGLVLGIALCRILLTCCPFFPVRQKADCGFGLAELARRSLVTTDRPDSPAGISWQRPGLQLLSITTDPSFYLYVV